jgi:hypothetical protein
MSPINLNARVELHSNVQGVLKALAGAQRETIKRGVEIGAKHAKRFVPVVSGHLKRSIKGKVRKARGRDELVGSISTNTKGTKVLATRGGRTYTKDVTYAYGADVELGRPGKKYKSTPFLRPGIVAAAPEIGAVLEEEARKAAARQGK